MSELSESERELVRRLLRSPLGVHVISTIAARVPSTWAASLTRDRAYEIVIRCASNLSEHAADYADRCRRLLDTAPSLEESAALVVRSPAAREWCVPLDRDHQVWVSYVGAPAPEEPQLLRDLGAFDHLTPKPRKTIWTSTAVEPYGSGWIPYLLWGGETRRPPFHLWRLPVLAEARVYEVHSAEEWHLLCQRYPEQKDGGLVHPRWERVARDWDGVHLSVGGLLTAEGIRTDDARGWTRLRGWSVESTVWLHWVFGTPVPLTAVTDADTARWLQDWSGV